MLKVQRFLRKLSKGKPELAEFALQKLEEKYAIKVVRHPSEKLVILNYNQVQSQKGKEIVGNCRGLTLHSETFDIVAKSFDRFYNFSECPMITRRFDWSSFTTQTKEDGSLMIMYFYEDKIRANTRGSFADGAVNETGITWKELFWSCVPKEKAENLTKSYSYVFELCSLHNKVIRVYPKPTPFLLAVFDNVSGEELEDEKVDEISNYLGVLRPERHTFHSVDDILSCLEKEEDCSFEGFVVKDKNGLRLKIKNEDYVRLHHLKGNNTFSPSKLVPIILKNRDAGDELESYFDVIKEYRKKIEEAYADLEKVWESAKSLQSQKEFALAVAKHPFSAVLFTTRKKGGNLGDVWRESADIIVKKIF